MNTVNRLGDRQWNKSRSKILPCADWVKLDMLRRALKLHEGKLSLRHRSADQSPFGHSIGPTISKRTRDSPGQIVITVISSLRSALCSLIHAQRNCMFWRFIWPLERFTFECTTRARLLRVVRLDSSRRSAQITGAICFIQIRVSVLPMTQKHCAVVSACQLQLLTYIYCTRCETDSARALQLTLSAPTDTLHQRAQENVLDLNAE